MSDLADERPERQCSSGQKTAFCIFGQLRDEHLSLPQIAEVARAHAATVFVSVWAKRGTKTRGATAIPHLRRMFGDEVAFAMPLDIQYDFHAAFPGIAALISNTGDAVSRDSIADYFPDATIDVEPEGIDLDFDCSNHGDVNSLRMLYRMWRCHRLMRRHEKQQGCRFDRVVQFRPDIIPPRVLPVVAADELHIPGGLQFDFVDDMLACGSPDAVAVVVSAFGRAASSILRPWEGIHKELYDIVRSRNISVKPILPARLIAEDFAVRSSINRGHLRSVLREERYEVRALGADRWRGLAQVLAIAVDVADGAGGEGDEEKLLALVDPSVDALVREAALSLLSCISEVGGRPASALAFEYLRVLTAVEANGIHHLNHFLFSYVMERLRKLCTAAGVDRCADIDPARFDFADDPALAREKSAAVARISAPLLATRLPLLFQQHADRAPYPDLRGFSNTFWSLFNGAGTREHAYAIALEMMKVSPLDWRGFDHMGHCEEAVGGRAKALEYAQMARERDSTHWGLHVRIAVLKAQGDDPDGSCAAFLAALDCRDGIHARDWFQDVKHRLPEAQVRRFEAEWARRFEAA